MITNKSIYCQNVKSKRFVVHVCQMHWLFIKFSFPRAFACKNSLHSTPVMYRIDHGEHRPGVVHGQHEPNVVHDQGDESHLHHV
jgi:hypothetical protein